MQALWLRSAAGPAHGRAIESIGDAILHYAQEEDVRLEHLWFTDAHADAQSTKFSPDKLYATLANEHVKRLAIRSSTLDPPDISFYLRPAQPNEIQATTCEVRVIVAGKVLNEQMRTLLSSLVTAYSVKQGFIAGFKTVDHAVMETDLQLIRRGIDRETKDRQWNDLTEDMFFGSKLRRLYPVTIIGRAIWESLPPLPTLARPPEIRDLGDCKMLIAWPELCSPHDPEFLAGTRELRQWLWPHTIQNPYDKLDLDV